MKKLFKYLFIFIFVILILIIIFWKQIFTFAYMRTYDTSPDNTSVTNEITLNSDKNSENYNIKKSTNDTISKTNIELNKNNNISKNNLTKLNKSKQITSIDKYNKDLLNKFVFSNEEKIVYLTFDDGPSKETLEILKILDKYNIKGTFFVIGSKLKTNKELIKKLYDEGHSIANHTYSHNYKYIYSNKENLISDIEKTDKELKNILGEGYNNKLFRFPGGSSKGNSELKQAVLETGYLYVDWNCLTGDAEMSSVSVQSQYIKYVQTSKNKNRLIILMHDMGGKRDVAIVLEKIIKDLKSKGYEFKTLEYRR